MTGSLILDERAVSEVAATVNNNAPLQAYLHQFNIDIPSLCATVKHLRAEVAEFERTDLVPRSRYNAADAESREAREQTKQLAHRAGMEIESLQSQLEQLRAENERLQDEIARWRGKWTTCLQHDDLLVSFKYTCPLCIKPDGPKWTCALCEQFVGDTDAMKDHQCPGMPVPYIAGREWFREGIKPEHEPFRVVPVGGGLEPQMRYHAGLTGLQFWMPLTLTGYWAEPEAFATGEIKGNYPLSKAEAEKAIERAKRIIEDKPLLALVEQK